MTTISEIKFVTGGLGEILPAVAGRQYLLLSATQTYRLIAANTTTEVNLTFNIGPGLGIAVFLKVPTIPETACIGYVQHAFPPGGLLTSVNKAIATEADGGAPAFQDCSLLYQEVDV